MTHHHRQDRLDISHWLLAGAFILFGMTAASAVARVAGPDRAERDRVDAAVERYVFAEVELRLSAAVAAATRNEHFVEPARLDGAEAARAVEFTAWAVASRAPVGRPVSIAIAEGQTVDDVLDEWAMDPEELAYLNEDIDLHALAAGDEITLWRPVPGVESSSIGHPNRGRLFAGVPMPEGPYWHVRNPAESWGTRETVESLVRGLTLVGTAIPNTQRVEVGDLSARHGGRLRPHRSHQSGRDIDVAYYRHDGRELTTFSSTGRVDVARQWLLFRHWIARGEAVYIFTDRTIMRQLEMYAAANEPDPEVYRAAFGTPGNEGIIRYSRGHSNHFHARFVCPANDTSCDDP